MREQQLCLEREKDSEAAANKLADLKSKAAEGDIDLPRAQRLIRKLHDDVEANIAAFQALSSTGAAAKYRNWVRKLPADVAAMIAIRVCLQAATSPSEGERTMNRIGVRIGQQFVTEARIIMAERVNPLYVQKVERQIKERKTTSTMHIQRVWDFATAEVFKGEIECTLSASDKLQIGKVGLQAVIDAGLLEEKRGVNYRGTLVTYELVPDIAQAVKGYGAADVADVVAPDWGFMMCPPDPWESQMGGGYLSPRRKTCYPLVSTRRLRRDARVAFAEEFTAEKVPLEFEVVNYLQETPMKLHAATMKAILGLWQGGGGTAGVPSRREPVPPPCPMPPEWRSDEGTEEEVLVFNTWKAHMVEYYDALRDWRARVREINSFLRSARNAGERVWLPMFMDTRGRKYYRGNLNPQGTDLAKGVILFGDDMPLGERGMYWMEVAAANHVGYDQPTMDARAAHGREVLKAVMACLDDPDTFASNWGETDAPWCLFTVAWEYREALRNPAGPEAHRTGLVVHMDATCSGLQHFAGLRLDPVGGRAVNLLTDPGQEAKADIYRLVAGHAVASLGNGEHGKFWKEFGISRSMAKKPVMTYVYGATLKGTADDVFSNALAGGAHPDAKTCFAAAKALFAGIAEAVPAAAETKSWLQSVAKDYPAGKAMRWTTPTGFPVYHDYQDFQEVRVRVRSCGQEYVRVRNFTDGTNKLRFSNAIAPNFVHSLDAAHLTFTAKAMKDAGCRMIAIHDSFGAHPCNVDTMHRLIREQFIKLYAPDVLRKFAEDVGTEHECLPRGELDLSSVLESEFFFC